MLFPSEKLNLLKAQKDTGEVRDEVGGQEGMSKARWPLAMQIFLAVGKELKDAGIKVCLTPSP